MNAIIIASREECMALFASHHVPSKKWGREGGSKPFDRFYTAYEQGELALFSLDSRLGYECTKVCARIFKPDYSAMLFETRTFHNGHVKKPSKKKSLSEKMLPNEHYTDAFIRMCKEEMQITVSPPDLESLTYQGYRAGEVHESDSYPGLVSVVHKYFVDWRMGSMHVRDSYREECTYCVNVSLWGKVPKDIALELQRSHAGPSLV